MCFKCTPTQPDNHCHHKEGKWSQSDLNRDLCTSCRKRRPFNIFVASLQEADSYLLMKLLCSYEALLFQQGYAIFFNCQLKYRKFKFFIKKKKNGKPKNEINLLPSQVAKVATSKIRGHNMFSFNNFLILKLGCEKPSPFKLMEFGIETNKLFIFKYIYISTNLNTSLASVEEECQNSKFSYNPISSILT